MASLTWWQDHYTNSVIFSSSLPIILNHCWFEQSKHTSKSLILSIEMAVHHKGKNHIVHWPRTPGVVHLWFCSTCSIIMKPKQCSGHYLQTSTGNYYIATTYVSQLVHDNSRDLQLRVSSELPGTSAWIRSDWIGCGDAYYNDLYYNFVI